MLYFELYNNNNNQYHLIFQSFPLQYPIPLTVHTKDRTLIKLIQIWYMSTNIRTRKWPNIIRSKYHHYLVIKLYRVPDNVSCHKSYKHRLITIRQSNMKSALNSIVCNQLIIILLLIIRPVYLGMCPSILVHIHSHMSKMRLVIENW